MLTIVQRPRQSGKTVGLLKLMAEDDRIVYVAATEQSAHGAWLAAKDMGLNLPRERFLASYRAAEQMSRLPPEDRRMVVDELDSVLWQLLRGEVAYATHTGQVSTPMLNEEEIRKAAFNWRAVADNAATIFKGQPDAEYQRGLAEGYASALEMVLRGGQQ